MLLPDESGSAIVAILPLGGAWQHVRTQRSERYSLILTIPAGLAHGRYELAVHSGAGGPSGWSASLPFSVNSAEIWLQKLWNIRVVRGVDILQADATEAE